MEMLKNLPSYNKDNFTKFTQGAVKVGGLDTGREREREHLIHVDKV